MDKEEIKEEVNKRSSIGKSYAKMQLGFIKWLAKQSRVFENGVKNG